MDVHIPSLTEIGTFMVQFPAMAVALGGILFGTSFTQLIKKTYLVYMPIARHPVSIARYRLSTRWLAALSTYFFSIWLWHSFLEHDGGEEVLCLGTAFMSPLLYDWARALIGWKFPGLTARWGRNYDTTLGD